MTFETLATDSKLKKTLIEDLNKFSSGKEYYKRIGKLGNEGGYLLYGPPSTGKSSLIAAMANHLTFDIYDLDLTDIHSNSQLKSLLLSISGRSILVIEDIDCSIELENRDYKSQPWNHGNSKLSAIIISAISKNCPYKVSSNNAL
ncbi:AAA-ATPase At3g50940-like [Quercus lobata]|uniref:AAA-ATPase At3g50940-like n=1 Tax=Quercus lobata TaxID=97700 RepID=UPI0012459521|nr:AAA-ATPase At3g50940-like [Quercus lobata]